jgi:hypothetical protein
MRVPASSYIASQSPNHADSLLSFSSWQKTEPRRG